MNNERISEIVRDGSGPMVKSLWMILGIVALPLAIGVSLLCYAWASTWNWGLIFQGLRTVGELAALVLIWNISSRVKQLRMQVYSLQYRNAIKAGVAEDALIHPIDFQEIA